MNRKIQLKFVPEVGCSKVTTPMGRSGVDGEDNRQMQQSYTSSGSVASCIGSVVSCVLIS
jgi:hypothetical protein